MMFFIVMLLLSYWFDTPTFLFIGVAWLALNQFDKPKIVKEIRIEGGKEL